MADETTSIRPPAEILYAKELARLEREDKDKMKPPGWRMSPENIIHFVCGGNKCDKKWYGSARLVQQSVVTLLSDRGLLLIGDPGTGKSWLAELLAAAISGNSVRVVQGTAGTTEEHIKYNWNVAKVIAKGQSEDALIPSPIFTAMTSGQIARFEELTRSTSDVQDAMISILSEKYISVPELSSEKVFYAKPGFNIIATANSRDKGVNELSSALKRRFNFVQIPLLRDKEEERKVILFRTQELLKRNNIDRPADLGMLDLILQAFDTLRADQKYAADDSGDGKLESPLSTAEALNVMEDASLHQSIFKGSSVGSSAAESFIQTLIRRMPEDATIVNKFWQSSLSKTFNETPTALKTDFLNAGKTVLAELK